MENRKKSKGNEPLIEAARKSSNAFQKRVPEKWRKVAERMAEVEISKIADAEEKAMEVVQGKINQLGFVRKTALKAELSLQMAKIAILETLTKEEQREGGKKAAEKLRVCIEKYIGPCEELRKSMNLMFNY